MPDPLNWDSVGGLEAVKTLTLQLGPREAARRLGLSEAHSNALRRRCSRDKWLQQPQKAPILPKTITGTPVSAVSTPSQALESSFMEDGKKGRIAAARVSREALEGMTRLTPEEMRADSKALRDLMEVSAKSGGWADPGANQAVTVNLAVMGHGMPSELRANYILPVDQSAGQDDD